MIQTADHVEQRALAAARWPDEADDGGVLDDEGCIADCVDLDIAGAIDLAQVLS
jgi:hypothetical protein